MELLQFPYSHFNEKARWALDWKGVAHQRRNLLPGPHAPSIQRLTGQTSVPVLKTDDGAVAGSAAIIDLLERRHPEPPLYPSDPKQRDRALALQAHFDSEVGPVVRRALFSELLAEPGYVARTFSEGHPALTRALYRGVVPFVRGRMRRDMGIVDRAAIDDAFERTRAALDRVAEEAGPEGYLVGSSFSVADLTAAALLAPAVGPEDSPMELPHPRPACLEAWLERWAAHPGAAWVREQYRRHRGSKHN